MSDLISRQAVKNKKVYSEERHEYVVPVAEIDWLPSAQPERLTDDDFETIRIHLNAYKESLCNQGRWKEAEDYQRIIDRFMTFASAEPEREKGKWIRHPEKKNIYGGKCVECSACGEMYIVQYIEDEKFCRNCGADMRGTE